MEWPVLIDSQTGSYIDATFYIRSNNGQVFIEFTDNCKESFVVDSLSSYSKIDFDENDPLHVKFIGHDPHFIRNFKFLTEDSLANVWNYLLNFVDLSYINGENRSFAICPKNSTSSPPILPPVIRQTLTFKQFNPSAVCIPVSEAIKSNLISQTLSDVQTKHLNERTYDEYFNLLNSLEHKKEDLPLYQMEIDPAFTVDLWLKIFNIDSSKLEQKIKEYSIMKSQWNPFSKEQWKRSIELRIYVQNLEQYLQIFLKKPEDRQKSEMIFNVLMTYFIVQLNPIRFSNFTCCLVDFLIRSLVAMKNQDNTFTTHSGEKIESERVEAIVFILFLEFYFHFVDQNSGVFILRPYYQLFSDTLEILRQQSPSTVELLSQSKIKSFDFLLPIIDSCFSGRELDHWQLLFTGLISTKAPKKFFPCALASTIILLQQRLFEYPELFKDQFIAGLLNIDTRLLLYNTKRLIEITLDEN